MPGCEKKDICFESADGHSTVAGVLYLNPEVKPFCVLQISHGMQEHVARYEGFAGFLCENGVAVCGNDHLGHGRTAAHEADLGYFGEKGGHLWALKDLARMNEMARAAFPGLPLVMLGHSMGSFFARKYAVLYPDKLDGLILSGTAGKNPLTGLGLATALLLMRLKGPRHRSELMEKMAFGSYLKQIEVPKTPHDWLSRDEDVVAAYEADPNSSFKFTVNGYHELLSALREVSGPHWAVGIRKNMPVLMIQGGADPVGGYGKGTAQVRGWLRGAGVVNLEYITYPGARHEVLNETNRTEVYADVLAFINRWWGGAAPSGLN